MWFKSILENYFIWLSLRWSLNIKLSIVSCAWLFINADRLATSDIDECKGFSEIVEFLLNLSLIYKGIPPSFFILVFDKKREDIHYFW